jgi:hypothetical protein
MAPKMPRGLLILFVFALCFMPSSILVMGWEGGSFQHVDAPTLHTRKHGPKHGLCWIIKEDPGGDGPSNLPQLPPFTWGVRGKVDPPPLYGSVNFDVASPTTATTMAPPSYTDSSTFAPPPPLPPT